MLQIYPVLRVSLRSDWFFQAYIVRAYDEAD